jgi:CheY-like chemotaxis protein
MNVLIVDDEALHRETLAALLREEALDVTSCERATSALALLRAQRRYNLIITDVVMPGMDGIEFAREARRLRPEIPLIVVTGHDSAMDRLVEEGAIALIKPYSSDALKRVLDEQLGRA